MKFTAIFAACAALAPLTPLAAQDAAQDAEDAPPADVTGADEPEGIRGVGEFFSVGAGVALIPSYDGSDDYTISPLPLVQGSIGGVGVSPRAGGFALDLVPNSIGGARIVAGPAIRVRLNRTGDTHDDVVNLLPERDIAVELGVSGGVSFPAVLNPYDRLTVSTDVSWDIAGAHGGNVVTPVVSYVTPLSEGIAALLAISGEYVSNDFMDYYYSVTPADAAVSGLPQFDADAGFRNVGAQLLVGFDLNGDLRDGGLALFAMGGYSRMLGDAAATPLTSLRGSKDQWLLGAGLAYTF